MTNTQALAVQSFLARLTSTMVTGEATKMFGRLHGWDQWVMGIVNRIERESGSGFTYNVTTTDGHVLFIDLRRHVQA